MNEPVIKLGVEMAKERVLFVINSHYGEYQEALAAALKTAINNFDFEKEIAEITEQQLKVMCLDVIKGVVRDVMWDKKFSNVLKERMIEEFKKRQFVED